MHSRNSGCHRNRRARGRSDQAAASCPRARSGRRPSPYARALRRMPDPRVPRGSSTASASRPARRSAQRAPPHGCTGRTRGRRPGGAAHRPVALLYARFSRGPLATSPLPSHPSAGSDPRARRRRRDTPGGEGAYRPRRASDARSPRPISSKPAVGTEPCDGRGPARPRAAITSAEPAGASPSNRSLHGASIPDRHRLASSMVKTTGRSSVSSQSGGPATTSMWMKARGSARSHSPSRLVLPYPAGAVISTIRS